MIDRRAVAQCEPIHHPPTQRGGCCPRPLSVCAATTGKNAMGDDNVHARYSSQTVPLPSGHAALTDRLRHTSQ